MAVPRNQESAERPDGLHRALQTPVRPTKQARLHHRVGRIRMSAQWQANRTREPTLPPYPVQIERVTPTYEWPGPSKPPPQPRKRRDQAEAEPQDDDDQEEGDADDEEVADGEEEVDAEEATALSDEQLAYILQTEEYGGQTRKRQRNQFVIAVSDDDDQPSSSPSESSATDKRTARDEELARMLIHAQASGINPEEIKRERQERNTAAERKKKEAWTAEDKAWDAWVRKTHRFQIEQPAARLKDAGATEEAVKKWKKDARDPRKAWLNMAPDQRPRIPALPAFPVPITPIQTNYDFPGPTRPVFRRQNTTIEDEDEDESIQSSEEEQRSNIKCRNQFVVDSDSDSDEEAPATTDEQLALILQTEEYGGQARKGRRNRFVIPNSSDDDHDQLSSSPSQSLATDKRTARDEELARMLQEEEYGGPPSNKRARLEVNYDTDDGIGQPSSSRVAISQPSSSRPARNQSSAPNTRTSRDEELARILQEEEYTGQTSTKRARLEIKDSDDEDDMRPSKSKRAIILDSDDEEMSSEQEDEWIPKFAGDKGNGRAMPPADTKGKGKAVQTDDDDDDDNDSYMSDTDSVDLVEIPDHDEIVPRVDKGKGRATWMRDGEDDIWRMTEDELLATAQLYTRQIHLENYEKLFPHDDKPLDKSPYTSKPLDNTSEHKMTGEWDDDDLDSPVDNLRVDEHQRKWAEDRIRLQDAKTHNKQSKAIENPKLKD
ncbi:hypothetical protein HDK64DRAFT_306489 [Phyllosticta capitalensis]